MASHLNQPHFQDVTAARKYLERIRWVDGPVCPHCGSISTDHYRLEGDAHRVGLMKCKDCRKQFSVTVGTVFERSKIALNIWLQAVYFLCSSKKGMSAHQLHRTLGVTYKTAWFMAHRIREAMRTGGRGLLGSGGGVVEADETYWGTLPAAHRALKKYGGRLPPGGASKMKIVALVERGGNLRSFHVPNVTTANVREILHKHVAKDARFMTDESHVYTVPGREFTSHETVNHGRKEYARGDVHVNTLESYFNIFKRGLAGTFHHVSEQHLQRYCTEFDFRYNTRTAAGFTDEARTQVALKGVTGKRLTYRRINGAA